MSSRDEGTGQETETSIHVTLLVIKKLDTSWKGPYDYVQEVTRVPNGSTLLEVMELAKRTGAFTFETKTYVDLGEFVTSVMGVKANEEKSEYWGLLDGDTGTFLNYGVSTYEPKDKQRVFFHLNINQSKTC